MKLVLSVFAIRVYCQIVVQIQIRILWIDLTVETNQGATLAGRSIKESSADEYFPVST